jgi:hypothetical protein
MKQILLLILTAVFSLTTIKADTTPWLPSPGNRKIVHFQFVAAQGLGGYLVALCDDGTLWQIWYNPHGKRASQEPWTLLAEPEK